MISNEMAAKFNLPPISEYPFGEKIYYHTFLIQSDYVANKIAESLYLNEDLDEDYTDILLARKFAREKINELKEENE